MSVIYLTQHDENIYDVIKPRKEKYIKPPRYISSFNKKVKIEMAKRDKKEKYSTMGPAEYIPINPKNFLKKRTGNSGKTLGSPQKANITNIETQIPKPEKEKERKPKKNYIRKNIYEIKSIVFREPEPKYIDTRLGHICTLEPSGLKPKYSVDKTKYGKQPNYLSKIMREKENEKTAIRDIAQINSLPKCRYITRQERDDLLNGLKKNWEEMQKEFQLLPMITDTIPKINRKVKLEKDLQALEKDIIMIEKHPYMYIDDSYYAELTSN